MKFEETIQMMFDRYPMLYTERWQCLDHLFCVIGNGYDWVNGELVSKDADSPHTDTLKVVFNGKAMLNKEQARLQLEKWLEEVYQPYQTRQQERLIAMTKEKMSNMTEEEKENVYRQNGVSNEAELLHTLMEVLVHQKLQQEIQAEIEELFEPQPVDFYPLSTSSYLFQLPQDIQPDWLEGAKETVALLLQHRNEDVAKMNAYQRGEYEQTTRLLQELAHNL